MIRQPDTVPGDVVVVLQQTDHAVFKRDGPNLIMEKKITLVEALCGFTFYIKHLDRRTLVRGVTVSVSALFIFCFS
jgi:DnaJ family protein A protein 2